LIGAVIAGPVADRIGRKTVLVAATLEFALGALLTTQVDSPGSLFAIRLVTGLGIGAALPNAVALTNEYSPLRRRSTLLVVVLCGITLGSVSAGLVAAHILPV
jgi:MFS transporter, AAHS family, 4-hydroxybenzoate transporter